MEGAGQRPAECERAQRNQPEAEPDNAERSADEKPALRDDRGVRHREHARANAGRQSDQSILQDAQNEHRPYRHQVRAMQGPVEGGDEGERRGDWFERRNVQRHDGDNDENHRHPAWHELARQNIPPPPETIAHCAWACTPGSPFTRLDAPRWIVANGGSTCIGSMP